MRRRLLGSRSHLDPIAINYRDVVIPGNPASTALTGIEFSALDKYIKGLKKAGLWPGIIEHNCFFGANGADVNTARKPIKLGPDGAVNGAYQWSAGGFASVNSNGALGNGVNGSLMGLRPSNAFPSAASAGISLYIHTMTAAGLIIDCGAFDGLQACSLLCNFDLGGGPITQGLIWDAAGGAGAGDNLVKTPSPGVAGFYSMSRTGANVAKLYFANSTTPFSEIATTALNNQTWFNTQQMMMFAANNGAFFDPSARRYSNAIWHKGFSRNETENLYNLTQTFLMRKGGGFV